ncbi:MAG: fibronectin type III domain-containing protein, partial [Candidatus Heimdallarchaeota archaeon]
SEYYTIIQPLSEPTKPQDLLASTEESFVKLTWNSPINDGGSAITEYRIYRGTISGNYVLIFVTTLKEFIDTFVEGGTTYYYVITAVNSVGESAYSIEVNTIPLTQNQQTEVITKTEISTITKTQTKVSSETKTEKTYFPFLPVIMLILIIPTLRRRFIKN